MIGQLVIEVSEDGEEADGVVFVVVGEHGESGK